MVPKSMIRQGEINNRRWLNPEVAEHSDMPHQPNTVTTSLPNAYSKCAMSAHGSRRRRRDGEVEHASVAGERIAAGTAANPQVYRYCVWGEAYYVIDHPRWKRVRSRAYNYDFNKETGLFVRWDADLSSDPPFSPLGPEILDIEISVNGCHNACPFCYKNNQSGPATNMSLEAFKAIIDKLPKSLTQVAFGITGAATNPDFLGMMEYCRTLGVVPNFTLSGADLTEAFARQCARLVGAVAVSAYATNKHICYDTVKRFADLGVRQTNVHLMVSRETLPFVFEVLNDRIHDPRLKRMNAIVFLGVKPKGRARGSYSPLPGDEFERLIRFCSDNNVRFGFDSCSAPKYEAFVNATGWDDDHKSRLIQLSESCESTLFSSYVNVKGEYWHCSFAEGEPGQDPVNVANCGDFLGDVWYAPRVAAFRQRLMDSADGGCRSCLLFPSINA